ncbi:MAG: hypothetical protein IPM66_12630 [Acidobacteriota bacterium]|nr:MAG: hypothetical protein IPM66_12630 [Acidobacteriota bacterium]
MIGFGQAVSDLGEDRHPVEPAAGSAEAIDRIPSARPAGSSESYERVWQLTGPFGGDVTALAAHPRNADTVLLGTSDGQLFRSTDGGLIWRRIRPGIQANGFMITVIRYDLRNPDILYVGVKAVTALGERTKGGSLFVSEDGGASWREFEGMHGRAVRSFSQSPSNPEVLVAAALDGIYRTPDHGRHWERITPVNDSELRGFHSVAIDPRDEKIIYVGTNHLPWKTLDGGQTWNRAGTKETGMLDDSDIFAIHIDASDPDVVLMSACSGIYRSLDASAKWTKIQGIPYTSRRTHVIYQHPTRPEMVFAGTTEGLWVSTDHGKAESWRLVTSQRLVINAVAVHPERPDRVFLGTEDNGILLSVDGGETYEPSNAGFINRQVRAVLADRKEKGRVYAGVIFDSSNGGLFISEDGGLTWQQSMNGMGVRDVYSLHQSESSPETIYAGTNHGLFRSDDHGLNWTFVKKEELPPPDPKAKPPAAKSPARGTTRPRRISELSFGFRFQPIAYTRPQKGRTTRKKTQTRRTARKKSKPPVPVVSDLVEIQNQVFAITPLTPIPNSDGDETQVLQTWLLASTWDGLYRTDDEKKGWKKVNLIAADPATGVVPRQPRINSVTTTPMAPGTIFVGTEEGLFASRDNGNSFTRIRLDEEDRRIRIVTLDPRSAERIYVGTSTGFFRSADGGATWENRGGGMPLLTDVSAIEINALNPDEIYVGDEMRGQFFYSRDRGVNWIQLDTSQLPSGKIWSASSDPFDRNKLYLGSFSGGVYVLTRR